MKFFFILCLHRYVRMTFLDYFVSQFGTLKEVHSFTHWQALRADERPRRQDVIGCSEINAKTQSLGGGALCLLL